MDFQQDYQHQSSASPFPPDPYSKGSAQRGRSGGRPPPAVLGTGGGQQDYGEDEIDRHPLPYAYPVTANYCDSPSARGGAHDGGSDIDEREVAGIFAPPLAAGVGEADVQRRLDEEAEEWRENQQRAEGARGRPVGGPDAGSGADWGGGGPGDANHPLGNVYDPKHPDGVGPAGARLDLMRSGKDMPLAQAEDLAQKAQVQAAKARMRGADSVHMHAFNDVVCLSEALQRELHSRDAALKHGEQQRQMLIREQDELRSANTLLIEASGPEYQKLQETTLRAADLQREYERQGQEIRDLRAHEADTANILAVVEEALHAAKENSTQQHEERQQLVAALEHKGRELHEAENRAEEQRRGIEATKRAGAQMVKEKHDELVRYQEEVGRVHEQEAQLQAKVRCGDEMVRELRGQLQEMEAAVEDKEAEQYATQTRLAKTHEELAATAERSAATEADARGRVAASATAQARMRERCAAALAQRGVAAHMSLRFNAWRATATAAAYEAGTEEFQRRSEAEVSAAWAQCDAARMHADRLQLAYNDMEIKYNLEADKVVDLMICKRELEELKIIIRDIENDPAAGGGQSPTEGRRSGPMSGIETAEQSRRFLIVRDEMHVWQTIRNEAQHTEDTSDWADGLRIMEEQMNVVAKGLQDLNFDASPRSVEKSILSRRESMREEFDKQTEAHERKRRDSIARRAERGGSPRSMAREMQRTMQERLHGQREAMLQQATRSMKKVTNQLEEKQAAELSRLMGRWEKERHDINIQHDRGMQEANGHIKILQERCNSLVAELRDLHEEKSALELECHRYTTLSESLHETLEKERVEWERRIARWQKFSVESCAPMLCNGANDKLMRSKFAKLRMFGTIQRHRGHKLRLSGDYEQSNLRALLLRWFASLRTQTLYRRMEHKDNWHRIVDAIQKRCWMREQLRGMYLDWMNKCMWMGDSRRKQQMRELAQRMQEAEATAAILTQQNAELGRRATMAEAAADDAEQRANVAAGAAGEAERERAVMAAALTEARRERQQARDTAQLVFDEHTRALAAAEERMRAEVGAAEGAAADAIDARERRARADDAVRAQRRAVDVAEEETRRVERSARRESEEERWREQYRRAEQRQRRATGVVAPALQQLLYTRWAGRVYWNKLGSYRQLRNHSRVAVAARAGFAAEVLGALPAELRLRAGQDPDSVAACRAAVGAAAARVEEAAVAEQLHRAQVDRSQQLAREAAAARERGAALSATVAELEGVLERQRLEIGWKDRRMALLQDTVSEGARSAEARRLPPSSHPAPPPRAAPPRAAPRRRAASPRDGRPRRGSPGAPLRTARPQQGSADAGRGTPGRTPRRPPAAPAAASSTTSSDHLGDDGGRAEAWPTDSPQRRTGADLPRPRLRLSPRRR